jgi:hypothetical protein
VDICEGLLLIAAFTDHILLVLWGLVFLLLLLSQAVIVFVGYRRLDQIEAHFTASSLVSINRKIAGNGPIGRMKRVRLIGALTGSFYPHQMLDPRAFMEAEALPQRLRRWLVIPRRLVHTAIFLAVLAMLGNGGLYFHEVTASAMGDSKLVYTAAWLALISSTAVIILFRVYLGYFKLEEMEALLGTSYFVGRNRRVMGDGLYARHYRLTHLSLLLSAGQKFLLDTDPHAINEVEQFPLHLRRLIVIPHRMLAYSFLGFFALWFVGGYLGA